MKRLGNVYDRIIAPENLLIAFNKAAKGRRKYVVVRRAEAKLEANLAKLRQKLVDGSYMTGRYKSQVVFEPKRRTIHSLPFFPDRVVHHAILNVLGPYWDRMFIHDSYACRENKGQHAGSTRCMKMVRKHAYVLKCDISKFYHSIPHDVMKSVLRKKLKCPRTLALLDEIIDSSNTCVELSEGRGVPIGNLVSQWLGNLYLHEFDLFVKHELKCMNYIRYCDDFVLFSNSKSELRMWSDKIRQFLSERLQLRLSKCELFPVTHGVDYLGYRHFCDYILLRKSTAKRMRRRLAHVSRLLPTGNLQRLMGQVASASGWLRHANTYNFCLANMLKSLQERIDGRRCAEAI